MPVSAYPQAAFHRRSYVYASAVSPGPRPRSGPAAPAPSLSPAPAPKAGPTPPCPEPNMSSIIESGNNLPPCPARNAKTLPRGQQLPRPAPRHPTARPLFPLTSLHKTSHTHGPGKSSRHALNLRDYPRKLFGGLLGRPEPGANGPGTAPSPGQLSIGDGLIQAVLEPLQLHVPGYRNILESPGSCVPSTGGVDSAVRAARRLPGFKRRPAGSAFKGSWSYSRLNSRQTHPSRPRTHLSSTT